MTELWILTAEALGYFWALGPFCHCSCHRTWAASWRWHTPPGLCHSSHPIKRLSSWSHMSPEIHFCFHAHIRARWQYCPPSFHDLWQLVPGDPKELYLIKMRGIFSTSLRDLQLWRACRNRIKCWNVAFPCNFFHSQLSALLGVHIYSGKNHVLKSLQKLKVVLNCDSVHTEFTYYNHSKLHEFNNFLHPEITWIDSNSIVSSIQCILTKFQISVTLNSQ